MRNKNKFTTRYFYESTPKWKRVKDSPLSRIFYRPVSYFFAARCANLGLSANTVSYLSAIVALIACSLFIPSYYWCNVLGAALVNVWLIMDCVDGDLARGVKKQAFGDFADSMSSYLLLGFIVTAMSYCVFQNGGVFINSGTPWIILIGAVASTSDTMMRLIYQKYKATERDLQDKGIIKETYDVRTDKSQTNSWRIRLESDFGLSGILPLIILLGTIFYALDLVVFYCLFYYGGSFFFMTISLIKKAVHAQRKYDIN